MSDDMVKRLRESGSRSEVELHEDREEAADRIEELEAKLVKAMNALELASIRLGPDTSDADAGLIWDALAELKGETDGTC